MAAGPLAYFCTDLERASMRSTAAIRLVFCLVAASAIVIAMSALATAPAAAQEKIERKSFLQLLFGGGKKTESSSDQQKTKPTRTSRPSKKSVNRAPAAPVEPAIEKLDNARKVLVVGDFLASGLADGLKESFDKSPGVVIIGQTSGSSGLVRDDYYNWPAELPAIVEEYKPAIVVVQIGSNDSQKMRADGARLDVRSPEWLAEYERRTDALIKAATASGSQLVWVGLPSFNFTSMSADMLALNGITKSRVDHANGSFVDIWDGFVDEEGKFVFTGSDINGQQVRLRGSDGINMTKAGRRKMAFYAEKPIRRLLGSAADTSVGFTGLDASNLTELNLPGSQFETANPVRTLPVSMNDPDFDGGSQLLGGTVAQVNLTPTPRDRLVRDGEITEAPPGRVDNFSWPPKSPGE